MCGQSSNANRPYHKSIFIFNPFVIEISGMENYIIWSNGLLQMSRYSNSQKNDTIYLNMVLSFDLHSALAPIITRNGD